MAAVMEHHAGMLGDDELNWLEAPESADAMAWVKAMHMDSEAALTGMPQYQQILSDLEAINRAYGQMAPLYIAAGRLIRLKKSAPLPHGVLQSADYAGGNVGPWRDLLDVAQLSESEGRELHLQWETSSICSGTSRVLLDFHENGGDESEVWEFDLATGFFVTEGFRSPKARTVATWIDPDTVLIGHAATDSVVAPTGWPCSARVWRRGEPLAAAPIVWQMDAGHALFLVSTAGCQGHALISEAMDYSHIRKHVVSSGGSVLSLDIPNVGFMQSSASRSRAFCILREPSCLKGREVRADTLVAARFDVDSRSVELEVVFEPAEGEQIERATDIVLSDDAVGFVVRSGTDFRLEAAVLEAGSWKSRTLSASSPGECLTAVSTDTSQRAVVVLREGFLVPPVQELIRLDGTSIQLEVQSSDSELSNLVVDVLHATSKDGQRIDYYRVGPSSRKGPIPTLMTGYGAFGVSMSPAHYSGPSGAAFGGATLKIWFERGGALVLPLIRGGGEKGASWHKAAQRGLRQHSYDDFHAVAEALVADGYTKPSLLGVFGTSNGGLLSAVVAIQRPDLYGAFISDVPLTDMLRFPKMGMGAAWIDEYGDPESPADAKVLRSYSPVHNVRDGVQYPPALVTVATTDNRVGPGHARKLAKRLMDNGSVLYFQEPIGGGHGVSNALERPDMMAMRISFFVHHLMGSAASEQGAP